MKKNWFCLGMMSGTSGDGVDASIIRTNGINQYELIQDKYFEYDFYHTSKDNLDFISSIDLIETLNLYLSSISKLERNFIYKSLNPKCEPMLGKRGLYPSIGGQLKQNSNKDNNDDDNSEITLSAINWLMYLCDGKNDILDILVFNPYNPFAGVPNYITRLIANFCDYNKSIIVDKSNKLETDNASFTCVKRN